MPAHQPRPSSRPRIEAGDLRGRANHPYIADQALIDAANAALAIQRPLLLTGEAGCGKTDFAWAAARALAGQPGGEGAPPEPLECYVRSDTRARDLLYHYDAVRRFGDAQHGDDATKRRAERPHPYLHLGPLGRALLSPVRHVVLIDEIDKAPRDLPNDLLRELDQGSFDIPEIPTGAPDGERPIALDDPDTWRRRMRVAREDDDPTRPFVVITSNVERQLPDAFLRRCVFFHIPFPEQKLGKILAQWFDEPFDAASGRPRPPYLDLALEIAVAVRRDGDLKKVPGTAEVIDFATALSRCFGIDETVTLLRPAADRIRAKQPVDWQGVPLLGCLVKLEEDRRRLGLEPHAA